MLPHSNCFAQKFFVSFKTSQVVDFEITCVTYSFSSSYKQFFRLLFYKWIATFWHLHKCILLNCNIPPHTNCVAQKLFVSFKTSLVVDLIIFALFKTAQAVDLKITFVTFICLNLIQTIFRWITDYYYIVLNCNVLSHSDCIAENLFVI